MRRNPAKHRRAAFILALGTLASAARADRVTVKGTTLEGTVTAVTGKTVEMKTVYGKGTLSIAVDDIEAITTDGRVYVAHGDGEEAVGRILGIREGTLLVGEDPTQAERVDLGTINRVMAAEAVETSRLGRLRRTFSLWSGNFDVSFAATSATVDTTATAVAFRAVRTHAPTRFILEGAYRYGTEKRKDETQSTIADNIYGRVRGEYDFLPRWYAYGSGDVLYDAIQQLSYRAVPTAGVGYAIVDEKTLRWTAEAGGAYVFERYFGGETNDFFSIAFGSELVWSLPRDAELRARADYLPAVSDWANDYLLRGQLALTVPLIDFLAFKASLIDEYDSTPAPDTDPNSLATLVGLSLLF
jgi:hypothetical protein